MEKIFRPVPVFALMALVGCVFTFSSCDDDEGSMPPVPDEVTTDVMFGNYSGKMICADVAAFEDEGSDGGEEVPAGTDISATVDNDTVYFEDFPIKDLVLSVVQDETLADQIVEAVGKVNYQIGYKPTLTADEDSIALALNPEPLKLAVALPSPADEEEAEPLQIEVKVEAGSDAAYAVETGNAKFGLVATEVLLGGYGEQVPLEGFQGISLQFDMNQAKVAHNW